MENPLKLAPILKNFAVVLQQPQFITFAFTGALSYAGLYAYVGGAPYVFMELFTVSEAQFGWIFSFIAAGLIGASQLNNLALKKYSSEQVIRVASISQCVVGVAFVFTALSGWLTVLVAVFFVFLFLACQGFIFPNATALALAPLAQNAGDASALVGAIQMTIGAGASAVVCVLQGHSAVPMAGVMTCCAIAALSAFFLAKKY